MLQGLLDRPDSGTGLRASVHDECKQPRPRGSRRVPTTICSIVPAVMRHHALLVLAACGHPPAGTTDVDAPRPPIDGPMPDTAPSGIPYDSDGPVPYTMQTYQVANGATTFPVTAWIPSMPGLHPVVALSCGSQQTAAGYAPHARRLASYGILTIVEDDAGILTNTSDIVPNAEYVVTTWLAATFPGGADLTRVGLAGHSRGGAVSLITAEHLGGKITAWFGLDPVDNEFGQNPREYARTTLPQLTIPTAMLGASVTSNCAPTADSYATLFPLAPSPSTLVVGIGAGHTQLESPDACTACTICTPSGTADGNVVLAYTVRYTTAFFARELLGDSSVGADFAGAGGPGDVADHRVTITAK
jgi:hypothetical protein